MLVGTANLYGADLFLSVSSDHGSYMGRLDSTMGSWKEAVVAVVGLLLHQETWHPDVVVK